MTNQREETGVQERYRTGAPAGRGLYCGKDFIALFEQAAVARRTAELYNDAYGQVSAEGYNPRETRLARAAEKAAEDAERARSSLEALRGSADKLYKDNRELAEENTRLTESLRKADEVVRSSVKARDALSATVRRLEADLEELVKDNEELKTKLVRLQRRSSGQRKLDEKGRRIDVQEARRNP